MAETVDVIEEEEKDGLPKGMIFAAIVLFPLIPFGLIYLNRKMNKHLRAILMVSYLVFLLCCYQFACVSQGAIIRKVTIPETNITMKTNQTYQMSYKESPASVKVTKVTYTSNKHSVAIVNQQTGLVQTLTPGVVKISVHVTDNHYTTKTKKLKITVTK